MKPIFTTEDGVELFKNTDKVFAVTPWSMVNGIRFNKEGIPISQINNDDSLDPWKFFSTEEEAKKYEKIKMDNNKNLREWV